MANGLPQPGGGQRDQTKFIVFENFEKMNTQSIRQSLSEKELAWLENLQPIAGNNLVTVPAPMANALLTIGETIDTMFYAALSDVDYFVVFTTVGAGYLINIATAVASQFAPDGTFSTQPDVTTWQASRLLIADSKAGYSTFDGMVYVEQGGVSPNITVTNGGSGYGSVPTVVISGGSGSGALAHAVLTNGSVTSIVLDNPGHGYQVGDVLTVTISGSVGSGATGHVTMTNFSVAALQVLNPGVFTSPSSGVVTISFSGGGGTGARGYATIGAYGGTGRYISGVFLTSPGSGYTSAPTLTVAVSGGGGPGSVSLRAILSTESVATIALDTGGTGYLGPPAVSIVPSDGAGSGAAATATLSGTSVNALALNASAVVTLGIAFQGISSTPGTFALSFSGGGGSLAAGTATIGNYTNDSGTTSVGVISLAITNPGSGYTTAPTVTVSGATFSTNPTLEAFIVSQGSGYDLTPSVNIGAGIGATADAHVWPFINSTIVGDAFTTLAVFQGRVWLGGGNQLTWTGTGATYGNVGYDDFLAADASGSLVISDSDLIHAITALRSLNNYLFIMGDQSVKQIGNISLNSAGNVTLFTILTLSSDQGTIYPKSCISYNRVFMFANSNGIYGVFGSSVQKLSGDMDGIWKLVDFSQPPQGALADINAIHNAIFLIRYFDPIVGDRSIMLTFDGKKWFVTAQGDSLVAIATSASLATGQNSLYGSSGPDITELFAQPTLPVKFKLQSSMTHHGNAVQRKRLIAAGFSYSLAGFSVFSATVADGGAGGTPGPATFVVTGGAGQVATFAGTISAGGALTGPITVTSGGSYVTFPPSPAPVSIPGLIGATVNLVQVNNDVVETLETENNANAAILTIPIFVGFSTPGGSAGVAGSGKYLGMTLTSTTQGISGLTITNMIEEYQEAELWR